VVVFWFKFGVDMVGKGRTACTAPMLKMCDWQGMRGHLHLPGNKVPKMSYLQRGAGQELERPSSGLVLQCRDSAWDSVTSKSDQTLGPNIVII